jgi:sugar lactone lactonase YvrE
MLGWSISAVVYAGSLWNRWRNQFNYLFQEVVMEFFGLFRIVRRLPIVFSPVLLDRIRGRWAPRGASARCIHLGIALVAGLLLAGCGSSGGISSISSTVSVLSDPRGLAVDSSRNLYIADAGHHEIGEVSRSTGLLTTIAGTGLPGYSGDGFAATNAQLRFPQGVAVDSSGNLYIADTGNNVIREIAASSGVISTIVGVGAQLKGPQAVALDSSGNLYIADTGNNVIRKVVLSTGVISTVAGNGTAGFSGDGVATSVKLNSPADVKVDSSGNIFIADQANFAVREVSASSGVITTVAGLCTTTPTPTCSSGYTGDGGAATSALLNNPQAVAIDSSGNLYIADTGNNVIRKVSGGTISTVVGNGTAGYSGDGHSAIGAELNTPNGLIFDSSGTLYIDDAGNKAVRKVSF